MSIDKYLTLAVSDVVFRCEKIFENKTHEFGFYHYKVRVDHEHVCDLILTFKNGVHDVDYSIRKCAQNGGAVTGSIPYFDIETLSKNMLVQCGFSLDN